MKTVSAKRQGLKVARTVAREFIERRKAPAMPTVFAKRIAELVNEMTSTGSVASADVLANPKNYVYTTALENIKDIVGVAKLKRRTWKRCEVGNLFVTEACRKKGYGKRILEKVQNRAANRGFSTISATIDTDNLASESLFASQGYNKSFIYSCGGDKRKYSFWQKDITSGCKKHKGKKK